MAKWIITAIVDDDFDHDAANIYSKARFTLGERFSIDRLSVTEIRDSSSESNASDEEN